MSKLKTKVLWPSWRYSPEGEGKSFAGPEDVPEGWMTIEEHLARQEGERVPEDDVDALRAALDAKGVSYHHRAGAKRLAELLAEADA